MLSLKPLKVYFYVLYYHFLTILTYPYELLITVVEPALEVAFLALFWNMIAKGSNQHIDLGNMIAYFVMVQFVSIWVMNPGQLNFIGFLGWKIKSGQLSQALVRPVRTLPALLSEQRGYYVVDMIFSVILLGIALKLTGGVNFVQLGWFAIFLFLSFMITFSFCVLVTSLVFITKEFNSIRHSVSHLVRILSGSLVPLTFFPNNIRDALNFTPFPSMMFSPINVLQNKLPISNILSDLKISVIWSIILFGLAMFAWHRNMKKYEAIGI